MKPQKNKSLIDVPRLQRTFDALLEGFVQEKDLEQIADAIVKLITETRDSGDKAITELNQALQDFSQQISVLAENTNDSLETQQAAFAKELESLRNEVANIVVMDGEDADEEAIVERVLDVVEDRLEELQNMIPEVKEKSSDELKKLLDLKLEDIAGLPEKVQEMNTDMYKLGQEMVNITPRVEIFDDGQKVSSTHRLNFTGGTVTVTNGMANIPLGGSGGISDGDKGDITVSGSGATWTIDDGVVTEAKLNASVNASLDLADSASQPGHAHTESDISDLGNYEIKAVANGSLTAVNDTFYVCVSSSTFTDPSPTEGEGFAVFVRNGTATVGGTGYSTAGTIIHRIFHSGAWANYVYQTDGLSNVVEDTTPQLGGNLDVQSFGINTSALNGNIDFTPNGTGEIRLFGPFNTNGYGISENFIPNADDSYSLGSGSRQWYDLYLGASGFIYLNGTATLGTSGGERFLLNFNEIRGASNRELLSFTDNASAVNEITIANATTGNGPEIQATGNDTNINIELVPKGSGSVVIGSLTGVLRADSGVVSTDSDVTDLVTAASTALAGKVELATGSEIDTGTDATRAITPDALAGSNFGRGKIGFQCTDGSGAIATGDGKAYIRVPSELAGHNIIGFEVFVTAPSTSGTINVMLARGRQSSATSAHTFVDVLSTGLTIDANEYDSKDATTAYVINTSNDDLAEGDLLRIDIDSVGTGPTAVLGGNIITQLP